ncbi:NUDIX hydrolase [Streptacidiphilus melanogenes]|uniref:NUDIX hydrolase n=1 Tax=Streptacidiphilus melanogenes TaxID=411235 RepID=UPI0005AAE521|nr:NUDIX domain-containing protein [Streptacidiphilus melanogenes]
MPLPEFVRDLRAHVGRDPLWLSGITGVILDDRDRVLLTRRSDNGRWALLGGILEPGEEPGDAVVREAFEETGARVVPERLAAVMVDPPVVYPNGDQATYLALVFRCRYVDGEVRVNDDESLEVRWFAVEELPDDVTPHQREKVRLALRDEETTWFALSAVAPGVS